MASLKIDFSVSNILHKDKKLKDNSKSYTFRDINTKGFTVKQDHDGNPKQAYVASSSLDKEAVKAALHNILTFRSGEAILDPEFGLGAIYNLLYSPFDKHTTEKLLKTMRRIIADYEPRIEIIKIPTEVNEDDQTISMTIFYSIPALNATDSYNLVLQK